MRPVAGSSSHRIAMHRSSARRRSSACKSCRESPPPPRPLAQRSGRNPVKTVSGEQLRPAASAGVVHRAAEGNQNISGGRHGRRTNSRLASGRRRGLRLRIGAVPARVQSRRYQAPGAAAGARVSCKFDNNKSKSRGETLETIGYRHRRSSAFMPSQSSSWHNGYRGKRVRIRRTPRIISSPAARCLGGPSAPR